jgi:hypothetical protein
VRPKPFTVRRWRGMTNAGPAQRLIIRDAARRRVGFFDLDTSLLYLDGDEEDLATDFEAEADRPDAVRELERLGHQVTGPTADEIENMPFPSGITFYPGQKNDIDCTKIYLPGDFPQPSGITPDGRYVDDAGRYARDDPSAIYYPTLDVLDVASEAARAGIESALLRGGYRISRSGKPRAVEAGTLFKIAPLELDVAPKWKPFASEARSTPRARDIACSPLPDQLKRLPTELSNVLTINLRKAHVLHVQIGPDRVESGDHWRHSDRIRFEHLEDFSERFPDTIWTANVDQYIDHLISGYGGHFPRVFTEEAEFRFPDLWASACELYASNDTRTPRQMGQEWILRSFRVRFLEQAVVLRTRRRRAWRTPNGECSICGEKYKGANLGTDWLIQYGPIRWCNWCMHAATGSTPEPWDEPAHTDRAIVASTFRHFVEVCGYLPSADWSKQPVPQQLREEDRDRILIARMLMPDPNALRNLYDGTWTEVLQQLGLLGDSYRLSRGVISKAQDGHPCRSLLERAIDDFMFTAGIAHTVEPIYPYHKLYNPGGGRRADWRLEDGTLIEAAGMLGDPNYASRLHEKRLLCQDLGLQLIVISPNDLGKLDDLLSSYSRR